ncbi:hypothetical protein HPB47_014513 [Ixodes persulcatus]|uniref:Uncharacterized protein n=1 Tax=Ixodes persulcatus TaxID=34615 RepID=A0AC60R0V0_IXOPE|nr:hypothetical protein HPB47_014513 [Ixodes persulcatus]
MTAELQGTLRVEVEKRVDLPAHWQEMRGTARVVPGMQRASEQGGSSADTKEVSRTYREPAQKERETGGSLEPNLMPVVNGGQGSSVVPGAGGQPSALRRVKGDKGVQVEAQPGMYMVDAIAKAEEVSRNNMEGENLVLINAGLNDVLNGKSQNLRKQI